MRNQQFDPGVTEAAAALLGGVGAPSINPYYPPSVGAPQVNPYFPGVGAPAVPAATPPGAITFIPEGYSKGNVTWLGFGKTVIAAGATSVEVEISTARPFLPQQLRFPSTIQGLLVNNFSIQETNFFANSAGVPIENFSEVATPLPLELETIDPASGASLIVSNPTGSAVALSGAAWGVSLRR